MQLSKTDFLMRLFYTPNSPYARIARVTTLELNLGKQVQMQKVTVRDHNSYLLNYNPTGKVPTLETNDGFILSETRIICAFLNHLNDEIKVVADISDQLSQQFEGIASGFLDGIAVWVREQRRPPSEQSPGVIELEQLRALRCIDHFERLADRLNQSPKLGHIILGCALGMEARLAEFQWRQHHPRLANWYDEFSRRLSMQATVPEVSILF